MKYVKLIGILLIAAILQISIMPNFGIKLAYPNLILIGLIILAINNRRDESLVWLLIGGLILDFYSPLRFGAITLSLLIIFVIVYLIFTKFISETIFPFVILAFFISSIIYDLVPFFTINKNMMLLFYNALYNTIVGVSLYYLIGNIKPNNNPYRL